MNANAITATPLPKSPAGPARLRWLASDAWVLAKRQFAHIRQIPEKLLDVTLQPLMFVLLFAFVFGGAIAVSGGSYREYVIGGVLIQSLAFGLVGPATAIATDLSEGVIDRFRSLPMARSAVLTGRSFADVIYNAGILVVLMVAGWFVGWTVRTDVFQFLAGVGLLLLFAFAMSWIGIWLGLSVPSVEVGQQVSFIVIFPITFISNAFVPIQTMPTWLQPFAEWNPVSTLTASVRELWGNPNPAAFATDSFPAQQPILVTLLWVALILAVFIPVGVRKYRTVSR